VESGAPGIKAEDVATEVSRVQRLSALRGPK